jgi:hypothetical protein
MRENRTPYGSAERIDRAHDAMAMFKTVIYFNAALREDAMEAICTPTCCGLGSRTRPSSSVLSCAWGSRLEVSAMGDRRKCQTFAASPAEPGSPAYARSSARTMPIYLFHAAGYGMPP